jgi:hypothetical protein
MVLLNKNDNPNTAGMRVALTSTIKESPQDREIQFRHGRDPRILNF